MNEAVTEGLIRRDVLAEVYSYSSYSYFVDGTTARQQAAARRNPNYYGESGPVCCVESANAVAVQSAEAG